MLKLIYRVSVEVKNCEVGVMLNEMSEEERQTLNELTHLWYRSNEAGE